MKVSPLEGQQLKKENKGECLKKKLNSIKKRNKYKKIKLTKKVNKYKKKIKNNIQKFKFSFNLN
tara:strand:- start:4 stop:195 length:192 start_codon:yes stop_codon:yes gene_type:complete